MHTKPEELEELLRSVSPAETLRRERSQLWIILLLVLILLAALVIMASGVLRLPRAVPSVAIPRQPTPELLVAGAADGKALLLVGEGSTYRQVKMATVSTDTVKVEDLSRGRAQVLAAALSLKGGLVACIREENGHRLAVTLDIATGRESALPADKLANPVGGPPLEPCSWSPVVWSPDGSRFSCFACDAARSFLVIVNARGELSPIVLQKTQSGQEHVRQVQWLDDQALLYTQLDAQTRQVSAWWVRPEADFEPVLVYGR